MELESKIGKLIKEIDHLKDENNSKLEKLISEYE